MGSGQYREGPMRGERVDNMGRGQYREGPMWEGEGRVGNMGRGQYREGANVGRGGWVIWGEGSTGEGPMWGGRVGNMGRGGSNMGKGQHGGVAGMGSN